LAEGSKELKWREAFREILVSSKVQRYLDKANECEHMAAKAKSREAAFLANDARQWRDLAKQAKHWDRVRGSMTENLRELQCTRLPLIGLGDQASSRRHVLSSRAAWRCSLPVCTSATRPQISHSGFSTIDFPLSARSSS
jgi:hypothetical protein